MASLLLLVGQTLTPAGAGFTTVTAKGPGTFTAAASFTSAYATAVQADTPWFYHRLADAAGATSMTDASVNNRAGTYNSTLSQPDYSTATTATRAPASTDYYGAPGIGNANGDTAAQFTPSVAAGPGTGMVTAETAVNNFAGVGYTSGTTTSSSSVELWFTVPNGATTGGQLIGFGDHPLLASTKNDRLLYVDSGGRLSYATRSGSAWLTIRSTAVVNDGNWHHVVATRHKQGTGNTPAGTLELYLDKVSQGSLATLAAVPEFAGYWRVGGDKLAAFGAVTNAPTSNYINAVIDEVAVYPAVLSAVRVAAHYDATGGTAYRDAVTADTPWLYWRLNETTAATRVADASGNNRTGAYYLGSTFHTGLTGAMTTSLANPATRFDGVTSLAHNPAQYLRSAHNNMNRFSLELWFKTTTTFGGHLIGMDSGLPGNEFSIDRMIFMNTSGKLRFGAYNSGEKFADSTAAYNDGNWHHVVATMDPAAVVGTTCASGGCMRLYVDGAQVGYHPTNAGEGGYDGYWRIGGDRGLIRYWQGDPNSKALANHFAGFIDEVAVYNTTLTAARVAAHYNAR